MKNPFLMLPFVLALVLAGAAPVMAQGVDRGVAVIDLKYIFDNYPKFQDMTARMKQDVERAEADIKKRKEGIRALEKQRNEHRQVSERFQELDDRVTRAKIELSAIVARQRKDFLQREARIYYDIYREIKAEVSNYAKARGFSLVLRFNGDILDQADADVKKVARHLNKPVVYVKPNSANHYDPNNRDITPAILAELQKRYPKARVGQGGSQIPRRGPR